MGANRDYYERRGKANRAYYLSRGMCPNCGGKRPVKPGTTLCFDCHEKRNTRDRRRMESETEEQRAVRLEYHRRYNAERTRMTQEKGLCGKCGKPALPGKRLCLDCLVKSRQRDEKRRIEKSKTGLPHSTFVAFGLCGVCGSDDLQEGKKVCKRCYANCLSSLKKASNTPGRKEATEFWRRQNRLVFKGPK